MPQTYQDRLYNELFNDSIENDDTFFKSIFTTPVAKDLLLKVLTANSEAIPVSSKVSDKNLIILRKLYAVGLNVLTEAIQYEEITIDTNEKKSSSSEALIDNGGGDITELSGNSSKNTSRQVLTDYDDGDDLTTLNGQNSTSKEDITNESTTSLQPKREFDYLDEKLRIQLVENVLQIFQTWFQNVITVNDILRKAKPTFDLNISIFHLIGEVKNPLTELFNKLNWFLNESIKEIEQSKEETQFLTLGASKETIILLNVILKSLLYSGFSLHEEESENFRVYKKLLAAFYEVNFMEALQKITKITNPVKTEDGYLPPRVVFSVETLANFYLLIGTLANAPSHVLLESKPNSDITTLSVKSYNPYRLLFDTNFEWDLFNQELNSRFLPFFCMEFNYCYSFRPDLMLQKIQNSSLINWISGNRLSSDVYVNCLTVETITNIKENNKLSILNNIENDLYVQELGQIYDSKISKLLASGSNDDANLDLAKLLPVFLNIYLLSQNSSFTYIFTTQKYQCYEKIDTRTDEELLDVELFEVWLCLLSYVFEYQYRSSILQNLTELSLGSLVNLPIKNLAKYQINEYKWKLCHQKTPFVPLNHGDLGFKSSLFYILDIIQNLLRFNLTYKLNTSNITLSLNLVYNILREFKDDTTIDLSTYPWDDFHLTLFGLIKFIKKQSTMKFKYANFEELGSLVEECVLILNLLLDPRFNVVQQKNDESEGSAILNIFGGPQTRSINYSLIYNILLNFETIESLLKQFDLEKCHLRYLYHCMDHFNGLFYLTEESKTNNHQDGKIDAIDFDFDSPEFVKAINAYTSKEEHDIPATFTEKPSSYKFSQTLKISSQQSEKAIISDKRMLGIIQNALSIKL